MANSIYALLVGIDEYAEKSGVPSLKGCKNDIQAIETYLRNQVAGDWELAEPKTLVDEQATRQGIIDGFQEYLCQAGSEDIALFYYSGHGGQERAPEEFWHLEPDRLDETLVCYDSRTSGSHDLADKEIRYLLAQVAKKNPRIIVILDSCHSGSGTRNISEGVRLAPEDTRDRSLDTFIFAEDEKFVKSLVAKSGSNETKTKKIGLDLPEGRHILLAACRDYQIAKEDRGDDGQVRGIFSYFLLRTLQGSNGRLSYDNIVRSVSASVNGKVKDQTPQLEATNPEDLKESFLGGAIPERPFSYILSYSNHDKGWNIDGGVIHGIPKPSFPNSDETTYLAIFPVGSSSERLKQPPIGTAKATNVLTEKSEVKIIYSEEQQERCDEGENYWTFVTSSPIERLKVYIKGQSNDKKDVHLAKKALEEANIQKSIYVTIVEDTKKADYNLLVHSGQYWVVQKDNALPLIAPIPENPNPSGYTKDNTQKFITALESIARWNNILNLKSQGSNIDPNQVEMEIILVGHGNNPDDLKPYEPNSSEPTLNQDSELCLEYIYDQGVWKPPVIKFKLTNKTDEDLYCNILFLSENYSVDWYGRETYVLRIENGEINRTRETTLDRLIIPDPFLKNGITEYKDTLKLIVSTTDFNTHPLEQHGLQPPPNVRGDSLPKGSLERLIQQINTRNLGGFEKKYDEWITKEVTVTIVKPQNTEKLQPNQSVQLLNGLVEVQPHPSLNAQIKLTTVSQTTRDIGNITFPSILWDEEGVIESFQFTTSRGSDPGLSAVELFPVQDATDINYNSVTKDAPLTLLVNQALEEDEYILPMSYDGEFFLPLGRGVKKGEQTEITLERLPQATTYSRSLGGSIKIFFKKLRHQKLGHSYEYPLLATAEVREEDDQLNIIYETDLEAVEEEVKSAQKILLYIHGIIGDTESMVGSVLRAKVEVDGQLQPLRELYDLVLTFDYENLKTTIEDNARLLKQRLESVGLGANHGKELHIVAHSMGGLVSRWFIEREGGNQMVNHLVMLGTPNAGSPWSAIQEGIFGVARFLNKEVGEIVPPAKVVANLINKFLEFVEANDDALDQMQPDSEFLQKLSNNPDPQVPYTIIAGNRNLANSPEQSQRLRHLMAKLFEPAVNKVLDDFVFGGEPNDIAVSLSSIQSVSQNRSPQPKVLPDAACDHLTYFTTEAGLKALSDALNSQLQLPL